MGSGLPNVAILCIFFIVLYCILLYLNLNVYFIYVLYKCLDKYYKCYNCYISLSILQKNQGHFYAHRGQPKGRSSELRSLTERGRPPLFEKHWMTSCAAKFLGLIISSKFEVFDNKKEICHPLHFI